MPRDLILHIGTSKTGSTSIQRVLSRQRRALLAQGVSYPKSPGFTRHAYLAWAAMANRTRVDKADRSVWRGKDPKARIETFKAEFDREMNELPSSVHRVIVSSEELSMRLLDRASVENLRDLLTPYFDAISVFVWLRRPDQHYVSLYSQMLRWGDAQPAGLADVDVPPAHGYDFRALLDRWANVFGESSIRPQLFERVPGRPLDVVQDFLRLCDVKLDLKPESKAASANEALSASAQTLLVQLAEQIRAGRKRNVTSPEWRTLVSVAEQIPGGSWQPTRSEALSFVEQFAENHEAVRQRWFPERTSLWEGDYSSFPDEAVMIPIETLLESSLKMLRKLASVVADLEDGAERASSGREKPRSEVA